MKLGTLMSLLSQLFRKRIGVAQSSGSDLLQQTSPIKARNLIEHFFNKIKYFRRIATRYDKLAENFLAALKLAAVRIWLR